MLLSFRTCTPRDYRVLLRFIREFYRSDRIRFNAAATGPALRKLLRDASLGKAFLLEAGKKPVGYAILTYNYDLEYGGVEGMLTDLYVIKESARSRFTKSKIFAANLELTLWNSRSAIATSPRKSFIAKPATNFSNAQSCIATFRPPNLRASRAANAPSFLSTGNTHP
jgi:hypothetical protein